MDKSEEIRDIIMGIITFIFMAVIPISIIIWIIIRPISFEFIMLRLALVYIFSFGCLGVMLSFGKRRVKNAK